MADQIIKLIHKAVFLAYCLFSKNKLNILIYHQVLEHKDLLRPSEPCKKEFNWQMQLVKDYFRPLPLKEAVSLLKNKKLPRGSICVTFDDGYKNNLDIAAPILQSHGVHATFFIATKFIDGENMWNDSIIDLFINERKQNVDLSAVGEGVVKLLNIADRRYWITKIINALKYLPVEKRQAIVDKLVADNRVHSKPKMMNVEEIKALAKLGFDIGAHTHNHPILAAGDIKSSDIEIITSKRILQSILGDVVDTFAYPNGKYEKDFLDTDMQLVRNAEFSLATSTDWGVNTSRDNFYRLKRFTPWDKTPLKFHLRLLKNLIGA
ncbi:polysaccharide deacetylase family protein [Thalassotalea maritima]|uniref:polysaccharide deacetylase family protein n=1 Tax=Thalassotalea maritima TaxID=3242416 RepID=UPI003528F3A0